MINLKSLRGSGIVNVKIVEKYNWAKNVKKNF